MLGNQLFQLYSQHNWRQIFVGDISFFRTAAFTTQLIFHPHISLVALCIPQHEARIKFGCLVRQGMRTDMACSSMSKIQAKIYVLASELLWIYYCSLDCFRKVYSGFLFSYPLHTCREEARPSKHGFCL